MYLNAKGRILGLNREHGFDKCGVTIHCVRRLDALVFINGEILSD